MRSLFFVAAVMPCVLLCSAGALAQVGQPDPNGEKTSFRYCRACPEPPPWSVATAQCPDGTVPVLDTICWLEHSPIYEEGRADITEVLGSKSVICDNCNPDASPQLCVINVEVSFTNTWAFETGLTFGGDIKKIELEMANVFNYEQSETIAYSVTCGTESVKPCRLVEYRAAVGVAKNAVLRRDHTYSLVYRIRNCDPTLPPSLGYIVKDCVRETSRVKGKRHDNLGAKCKLMRSERCCDETVVVPSVGS